MHSNIELLLQVQSLEQRLKELDSEIATMPQRIAALESRLATHQQALERSRAALTAHQSERQQVDRQIEALRARVEKSRSRSPEVKTNQEYKALKDEIAFAEGEIGKQEERLLQMMEESDSINQSIQEAETALATAHAALEGERQSLQTQGEQWQQERQGLLDEREQVRDKVDELSLRRFDRVFRLRGQGVTIIDGDVCGSCRVRLRPQFLQEVANRPATVFICESCSRILYFPEPAEMAAEASSPEA